MNAVSLKVDGRPHRFSMKLNGTTHAVEADNRREFFGALGFRESSVAAAAQVHGNKIEIVDGPGLSPETDALVTGKIGLLLAISVADCVPILMFDKKTKTAAAVHAGWRGTVKSIASTAVEFLEHEYGSKPEDMLAFVGPSAGVCCYEVGEEVAANFAEEFIEPGKTPGKYKLDLKAANAEQLTDRGIPRGNIEVSEYCTICNYDFHSFRRDGESSGRMLAVIGIRQEGVCAELSGI